MFKLKKCSNLENVKIEMFRLQNIHIYRMVKTKKLFESEKIKLEKSSKLKKLWPEKTGRETKKNQLENKRKLIVSANMLF
jgi:hypothetical protein